MGGGVWILAILGCILHGTQIVSSHAASKNTGPKVDTGPGRPNCSTIQEAALSRPPVGAEEKPIFHGLVPIFSLLSIVGGIFSLSSLTNQPMRVPANIYITGLCASDILVGVSGLFTFVFKLLDIDYQCREAYVGWFIVGGGYIGIIGGRVMSVFMLMLSMQRLVATFFPEKCKRFVLTKYPMVTLLSTLAICVFFCPSLFEYAVGKITPYHTNATLYLTMAPSFGASFPLHMDGQVTLMVFHHVIAGLVLILTLCTLIGHCMKEPEGEEENVEVGKEIVITRAYLIMAFVYILCMSPSLAASVINYAWNDFSEKGLQRGYFITFLNVHYLIEIIHCALRFPILMVSYTYFRHSLALRFGCKTPEDAQVLVTKTDDDDMF